MVEYCVYWVENGEPMHEVFSSLAAAEMYSCAIRGKENIEWVEVSEIDVNVFVFFVLDHLAEEERDILQIIPLDVVSWFHNIIVLIV